MNIKFIIGFVTMTIAGMMFGSLVIPSTSPWLIFIVIVSIAIGAALIRDALGPQKR